MSIPPGSQVPMEGFGMEHSIPHQSLLGCNNAYQLLPLIGCKLLANSQFDQTVLQLDEVLLSREHFVLY